MFNKDFSARNVAYFYLKFQIYFLGTGLLIWLVKPDAPTGRYLAWFLISHALLGFLLWNWKQKSKSEVLDEREANVRLKVSSFTSRAIEYALAVTIILSVTAYREMSALFGLLAVGIVAVFAEAYANYAFRKE